MYSEVAINKLISQIGWSGALAPSLPIEIDASAFISESGRTFESFHSLVNLENIYYSVSEKSTSEGPFNLYLQEVSKNAVLSVLSKIMDQSKGYDDSIDYDQVIITKKHLFIEAIGYSVACQMIELFLSTNRKNFVERNAKEAVARMKLDLEGARNDRGYKVATGLKDHLNKSIRKASNIIFPVVATVDSKPVW